MLINDLQIMYVIQISRKTATVKKNAKNIAA